MNSVPPRVSALSRSTFRSYAARSISAARSASAVPGARLKAAVRDLAVALRLARNQAITHDLETQVYINLEAPAYTVGSRAPHPLPAGVQLQVDTGSGQAAAQAGHHVIRFFSDGSSSGAVITLRSGERGYRLHLGWLTGRITIEDAQTDGR